MAEPAITQDWLNEPQQARSKETMNRFVLAAERLLREKAFDEITIGEIVEGADRTVGSFYARFDDKWALLRTVIHRYLTQVREFMDGLLEADEWAQHPFEELVRVTSHAGVGLYKAHGHIFRAGLAFAATNEPARRALTEHGAWMNARVCEAVLGHPEIAGTAPDRRRIELAVEAANAILDTRLLFLHNGDERDEDWDRIARDVESIFLAVSGLG